MSSSLDTVEVFPNIGVMYSQVNAALTWSNVISYGLVLMTVYMLYNQLIQPFLSPLRKIPGYPFVPLVGNRWQVMRDQTMDNTIRWMKMLKTPILRTYFFFGECRIIIASKEGFKHIIATNVSNYRRLDPKEVFIGKLVREVVGIPLFFLNDHEHHSIRRLCNPAFNISLLNRMVPNIECVTKTFNKMLKEHIAESGDCTGTVVTVQPWFSKMTLDAFMKCICDFDLGSLEGKNEEISSPIFRIVNNISFSLRMTYDPFYLKWPTKKNKDRWNDIDEMRNTIAEMIKSKRESFGKIKAMETTDILSQLLLAKDENGKGLSDEELYSQISGFMFAGHESTSTTLCWALVMLCKHPDVQQQARDEANRLIPTPDSCITPDVVEQMTYITSVLKETMRYDAFYENGIIRHRTNINVDNPITFRRDRDRQQEETQ